MDKVLPIIIICSVGIALALTYIGFVVVRACFFKNKRPKRRNEFEIEEDSLTIRLGRRKR